MVQLGDLSSWMSPRLVLETRGVVMFPRRMKGHMSMCVLGLSEASAEGRATSTKNAP